MPVFKDEERNTYYVKCYYTDWTGQRKQKLKRGFKLQREAKEWERVFLAQLAGTPDMTFGALCELYLADCKQRNKASTCRTKESICNVHLLPYWKDKPINQIGPADVRKWQSAVIASGIGQAYQYTVHTLFCTILNHAIRYHGLPSNPCRLTGPMGKSNIHRLDFWTLEQFQTFMATVNSVPLKTAFLVLFYGGLRRGEMLALTLEDFNQAAGTLTINKTYSRYHKADHITPPKTENSKRTVTLPAFLVDALRDYIGRIYGIQEKDRLFPTVTPKKLKRALDHGSKTVGLKPIPIHGLRHPYVKPTTKNIFCKSRTPQLPKY